MIREYLLPGLLRTALVADGVYAIRDGVVNLFVLCGPAGLICIDAGWRSSVVTKGFAQLGLDPDHVLAVFLTHSHWDHARGTSCFPRAKVYAGEAEAVEESQAVREGQIVTVAGLCVRALATPGHTAGSMSYLVGDRLLFTGDALRLRRARLVPNYPWLSADTQALKRSMEKMAAMEGVECLLTAHCGLTRQVQKAFESEVGA